MPSDYRHIEHRFQTIGTIIKNCSEQILIVFHSVGDFWSLWHTKSVNCPNLENSLGILHFSEFGCQRYQKSRKSENFSKICSGQFFIMLSIARKRCSMSRYRQAVGTPCSNLSKCCRAIEGALGEIFTQKPVSIWGQSSREFPMILYNLYQS